MLVELLDLTFASRACGQVRSEYQISSTSMRQSGAAVDCSSHAVQYGLSSRADIGHETPQRPEPFGEACLFQVFDPFIPVFDRAIERRPPLDQRSIVRRDGNNADGGLVVDNRDRRRAAERIRVRTVDVGMREQDLPSAAAALIGKAAHRAHLIRSLAVFDDRFAFDARPSVVIEPAYRRPDFIRGMVKHYAAGWSSTML